MKLTINAKTLSSALESVSGVVQTTTTMPILTCVKMDAKSGMLRITACDMVRQVTISIGADVDVPGTFAVPAKALRTVVSRMPASADVVIDVNPTSGRMIVTSRSAKLHLSTLPADDFPDITAEVGGDEIETPGGVLAGAINRVKFAMGNDTSRAYLNGVLLETDGNRVVVIATDGHRLVHTSLPISVSIPPTIVPRETVPEIVNIAQSYDPVFVRVSPAMIEVSADNIRLASRLVGAQFPDWRRLMALHGPAAKSVCTVTVPHVDIMDAVGRVAAVASGKEPMILTPGSGSLGISGIGEMDEVASDAVSAEVSGTPTSFGAVPSYIADVIKSLPSAAPVVIDLRSANLAAMFKSQGDDVTTCIVMPLRGKKAVDAEKAEKLASAA